MKLRAIILVASLIFSFTAFVHADDVLLKEVGVDYSSVVSVNLPTWSYDPSVYAGEYKLSISSTSAPSWNGTYWGFCVDPKLAPSDFANYSIMPVANDGSGYERAAWLFDKYGSAVTGSSNTATATATQLAIWELIFDTDHNVYTGAFAINTVGLQSSAQNMVDEAMRANLSNFDPTGFFIAQSPADGGSANLPYGYAEGWQDYIVYQASVPEPSCILLLGIGLITAAGVRRRIK